MAILQVSGPIGERFSVPANNDGPIDVILVDPTTLPAGLVAPFRAEFYVDPAFAGVQAGSSANPFTTVAAAWAAAAAQALIAAIVFIPAGVTVTENVVFPPGGSDWEIACKQPYAAGVGNAATIQGTVTCDTTSVFIALRLTRIAVTGAVTGNTLAGGSALYLNYARVSGAVTLTATAGNWLLYLQGIGTADLNGGSGRTSVAVSVAGPILADNWFFAGGPITDAAVPTTQSRYRGCLFAAPRQFVFNGAAGTAAQFHECQFTGPTTFTAATAKTLTFGALTWAQIMAQAGTFVGPITTQTANAQASALATLANNQAPVALTGSPVPAGLYEAVGTLDLLQAGILGTAQLNIQYTDLNGAVQTKPITGAGLLITAAVGTEAQGSLLFRHNGLASMAWGVSGVVTPGALSIAAAIAVMRRD